VLLDGDAPEAAARLYWNIAAIRGTLRTRLVTLDQFADPGSLGPTVVGQLVKAAISSSDGTS